MDEPTLRAQLDEALSLIAQLRADVERLVAENNSLRDRVAHLEAELAKNSENSSKPPSADPMQPRQSRAARRAEARDAARRQGKQPGAPGANLARREPDVTVEHRPVCCARLWGRSGRRRDRR